MREPKIISFNDVKRPEQAALVARLARSILRDRVDFAKSTVSKSAFFMYSKYDLIQNCLPFILAHPPTFTLGAGVAQDTEHFKLTR